MAAAAWGRDEQEQLLGMIFLLHLLNETLQRPSENSIDEPNVRFGKNLARALSLKREKELVEVLAFLSASTGDPSKVVAVCVEESQNGNALIIRMAVNNGGLTNVKDGFEKMARILEGVAAQGRVLPKQNEDALLREIVILNRNRILSRLRSKHANLRCNFKTRKLQRPKVLPKLADAVLELKETPLPSVPRTILDELKSHVHILQTLFMRLEAMTKLDAWSETGLSLLIEIIRAARNLNSIDALDTILRSSGLDPDMVTSLTSPIMKLGRYSTAARFLVRAAEELSIFANIKISVIKLSPAPSLLISEPQKLVQGVLNGIFDASEAENAAVEIKARLERKYSRVPLVDGVLSDISSTRFVVHAEIQLLFYYALQPKVLLPRIICFSKKACFLCNLFVKLHGQFIIPSSHGKLYEKWTLPESFNQLQGRQAERMRAVLNRFNNAVEEEFRLEVRMVRRPYPSPLESTIFASAVWSLLHGSQTTSSSTISQSTSIAKPRSLLGDQRPVHQDCHPDIRDIQVNAVAPPYNDSKHTSDVPLECTQSSAAGFIGGTRDPPHHAERSRVVSTEKSTKTSRTYFPLTRGESLVEELSDTREALQVATPRIHLTISFDGWKESMASLTRGSGSCRRYQVRLRWLPDCGESQQRRCVDLDAFPEGEQMTFDEGAHGSRFYISRGLMSYQSSILHSRYTTTLTQ